MNEKTADTFVSLYKHGIGVKCAIYYVAWAELFTMTDSFKQAAKVYRKGIDRLAEPIDLLKEAERLIFKFSANGSLSFVLEISTRFLREKCSILEKYSHP